MTISGTCPNKTKAIQFQQFMFTNMFKIVRFLSLPNLSNQMIAKSNGGPKKVIKVDKIKENISSVWFSNKSLEIKYNSDVLFESCKSMLHQKELTSVTMKAFGLTARESYLPQ